MDKDRRIEKNREAREAWKRERAPQNRPGLTAQLNFTEPESQTLRKSGKEYGQAHNVQAAIDSETQAIVPQGVGNCATGGRQLEPMVQRIKASADRQITEISAHVAYLRVQPCGVGEPLCRISSTATPMCLDEVYKQYTRHSQANEVGSSWAARRSLASRDSARSDLRGACDASRPGTLSYGNTDTLEKTCH